MVSMKLVSMLGSARQLEAGHPSDSSRAGPTARTRMTTSPKRRQGLPLRRRLQRYLQHSSGQSLSSRCMLGSVTLHHTHAPSRALSSDWRHTTHALLLDCHATGTSQLVSSQPGPLSGAAAGTAPHLPALSVYPIPRPPALPLGGSGPLLCTRHRGPSPGAPCLVRTPSISWATARPLESGLDPTFTSSESTQSPPRCPAGGPSGRGLHVPCRVTAGQPSRRTH
jgi:hypothetical protein